MLSHGSRQQWKTPPCGCVVLLARYGLNLEQNILFSYFGISDNLSEQIFCKCMGKRESHTTKNENVLILGPVLKLMSRILTTWLASVLLLGPVMILNSISNPKARLVIITLTPGILLSIVSVFTRAKTIEVIVAGAR